MNNELKLVDTYYDSGKGYCTTCEHIADCPPAAGCDYPYPVDPYAREDEGLPCADCGGVLVGIETAYMRGALAFCEGERDHE